MTNPQHLIDELRSFVHSSDQTLTDPLRELAAQYAATCREANQRLARCLDHLKKGLRSEAIHLAETEPALLDVVTALDFPERSQWDEISAMYGLAAAPALNLDAAKMLNEAYAEEQPLEDLLRRHRLLALARAPLSARLMILRRIASLDTLNPVWADDVRVFEKARLRQMHQEVEEAGRRGDNAAVAALAEEVRGGRWTVELPAGLVHHLDSVARQHAHSKALAALLKNENELNYAINAFDVGKARRLREEAQGLVKAAGLRPGDPVLERLSASLAWVEEQDRREADARRHEKLERELEQALDENAPRDELERLFYVIEKSGRGLSAPLEARYQARLKEIDGAARRKKNLLKIGAAAATVLVVVLGSWLVYRSALAGRLREAREAVQGHLDAKHVAEARFLLGDLEKSDPAVYNHADFAAVRAQFLEAERADQRRRQRLDDLLKELPEAAARPDLDGVAGRLRGLVQTADEEQRLREAVRLWEQQRQQRDLATEQKFRARLDDLDRRASELEKLLEQPRREDEAHDRLAGLDRDVRRLEGEVKGVSNELHAAARGLDGRLGRARKELEERRAEAGLLQELTASLQDARSVTPFVEGLARYAKRFPESARGRSFRRAVDEERIWEGVLAWNQLLGPTLPQPLGLSIAEAKAVAGKCEQFLKTFPQFPDARTAADYHRAVAAVALRDHDNKSGAVEDLRRLFSDSLVHNVYTVRLAGGETYYVLGDPRGAVDTHRRQGLPNVLLKSVADFTGKPESVTLRIVEIQEITLSRQSVLAQKVQAWLPKVDRTWDATLAEIARELAQDEAMDVVLRVKLLDRVLDCAARGSYPLGLALAEHRGHLKKSGVDTTVRWMRPGDGAANAMRPRAQKALRALPALTGVVKEAEAHKQGLVARVTATRLGLAGWLVKEAGAGWQCLVPVSLPRTGELLAATSQGEEQPAAWQAVGKVEDGRAVLDRTSPALLEGRVVFVRARE